MQTLGINGSRSGPLLYAEVLGALEPFKTSGSLRGERANGYIALGRLPERFRNETQARHDHIDYVVYSYATPIAWHDAELGWIIPDVQYSTTTSKQQGRVRAAFAFALGEYDTAPRI